mgnify:CR=1 FL=1
MTATVGCAVFYLLAGRPAVSPSRIRPPSSLSAHGSVQGHRRWAVCSAACHSIAVADSASKSRAS